MAAPLAWVRKIAAEVPQLNTIPLFGNAPSFDWHRLASLIASRFAVPHLEIHAREQTWREPDEMRKGLGKSLIVYPIVLSPIGTVYWIMSQEDMIKLTSSLLKPEGKTRALTSEILQEGFYRFLSLEVLEAIQGILPLQNLTLHLSEEERAPEGRTFCIDVEIEFEKKSCWGRLAIPDAFRTAWVRHFEQMPSEYKPTELSRQVELVLGVRTGSVLLGQSEWKSLKEGDFLVLDRGSYDAHKETGVATLTLGATPLFNVKIHNNKLSLIDYAFYYEDTMEQKPGEASQKVHPAEGEVVAIKELPLFVTVELARLKMTLDQLMHLNPGNTLELPIHPDQSVSLAVNGQKVGRAELVYLGETLGLRILELG
ncbi:MAG TPA: type III secretion system cytoplasmic ring protein SctQ [Chlamydiales bacterium]|nr:type III secretion system cytoplasmic ring protein SctQ [Chlamydiales bacterium]